MIYFSDFSAPGGGVAGFGALAYLTGGQTVTSTPGVALWDTEAYDASGWHDTVTNKSRFTVPSGVSLVRLAANLGSSGSTAAPMVEHLKNGASFRGQGKAEGQASATSPNFCNAVSAPIAVAAGDYLETQLSISSTGPSLGNGDEETWASIEKLDPATKYALVYHNASQSLGASVTTILAFNSEAVDTNGFHDTATNNSRLTVPSGVTLVRLVANGCDVSSTGQFNLFLNKNGATFRGRPNCDVDTANEDNINIVSPPLVVTSGDYFELGAFPDSATSVPSANNVWFSIEEVPSTYKRALVFKSGTQTFTAGVTATVSWDQEVYDTDGLHDNATNNSRLTVPAGCTEARPTFNLRTSSVTGRAHGWVTKNGSDYIGMPAFACDTTGTDNLNAMGAWVDVTPGDYFECRFASVAGCTIGTDNETWFCLECQ